MRVLDSKEEIVLELLAARPPAYLPPKHAKTAKGLQAKGLAVFWNDRWYPTASGLKRTGRVIH